MLKRWFWLAVMILMAGCSLNISPSGGLPSVPISGAPTVRIASPPPNAAYLEGVNVNIQALITNAGTDIARVEIAVDGTVILNLESPNPSGAASFSVTHSWAAVGVGDHTIGVTAFRGDGTSSSPATVNIRVVAQGGGQAQVTATQTTESGQPQAAVTRQATTAATQRPAATTAAATRAPTDPPAPTNPPPTPTSSSPQATFNQGVNVRSGPGTNFNPPIGSFASGQTTDIIAVNTAGDWFKVRYNSGEGWVYAPLATVSGDTAALPRDPGPPTPTALPPTPIPPTIPAVVPTVAPATNINLVAGILRIEPAQPRCGETFNVFLDVANLGGSNATTSGSISIQDVRVADGSPQGNTVGGFPVINAGLTVNSGPIPLTVSTYYGEDHRIVAIIDPANAIAETNEGDNRAELTYRLDRGSCP